MSDLLRSRQDQIHYAIWFGLTFVALLLLMAIKLGDPATYLLHRVSQRATGSERRGLACIFV